MIGPLILALLAVAVAPPRLVRQQPNPTFARDVYIIAHEDDWQLFMGNVAADRVGRGAQSTFIYLTAGDDGRDSTYWLTRERAALRSTLVLYGGGRNPSDLEVNCGVAVFNAHSIRSCRAGSSRSYFMRLPDGGRGGTGFRNHGYQSLRKVRSGRNVEIAAIDNSATYSGWNDLVATVQEIVRDQPGSPTTIHANDPNIVINPHDHYDHRITGRLAANVAHSQGLPALYYLGYALIAKVDNLSPAASKVKSNLFLSYDEEMIGANPKWSALAEHRQFYSECLRRTYSRRVPRR